MFGVGCGFVVASVPVGLAGLCGARDANAKKKGKPVPAGYKPRQWKLGLASCGIRGRGYLGIPDTARDLSKEEFDAILASWKGDYKIMAANTLEEPLDGTFGRNGPKVIGPLPPGGGATLRTLGMLGGGSDPPSKKFTPLGGGV